MHDSEFLFATSLLITVFIVWQKTLARFRVIATLIPTALNFITKSLLLSELAFIGLTRCFSSREARIDGERVAS